MKIERLVIENFKSIERIELIQPSPFTVFVGPNGSGKSNIFEALEFVNLSRHLPEEVKEFFGGNKSLLNRKSQNPNFKFEIDFGSFIEMERDYFSSVRRSESGRPLFSFDDVQLVDNSEHSSYEQFYDSFARLFIGKDELVKFAYKGDQKLSLSAKNLEKVLKRILTEDVLRKEIFEWLELFVPGFVAVEVDDRDELHWFEESLSEYFTKDLISDGTYNILALLTAVYQIDDKPQFLCIEEPENGLHPQVAGELTDFFRIMCEERGHHIWLNTHSQSIMARLEPEEMIVVEKKEGKTQTTQYKNRDFHGLRMDEALLTNVLGAGRPW